MVPRRTAGKPRLPAIDLQWRNQHDPQVVQDTPRAAGMPCH